MNLNQPIVAVSVVIPCYRCAKTIERAVDSVLTQTLLPAEILLVEDCSGDNTKAVLQVIKLKNPALIKIIEMKVNSGPGFARNTGWNMASQTYIAFLDADDAWHPKKIELQFQFMNSNPSVVLSGHGFKQLNENKLPHWHLVAEEPRPINKWQLILSNRFITPSVMVKRDIKSRFNENQYHMEDHMLWLDIICNGNKVVKLSNSLAAIYKDQFGSRGLSSHLWLMELGDLNNCLALYKKKYINIFQVTALCIYSILKFVRRLIIYWGYLRWKK